MKGHTLRFVHDAQAGQDRLHIPLWALFALAGAGQAVDSAFEGNANRDNQRALSQAEIESREKQHAQDVLLEESKLNPFRGQMFQAGSLASLDEMERGSYTPVQLEASGPYAKYVPKMSGGYSYTKSPELTQAAGALKNDVLAGHRPDSVLRPDIAVNRSPANRRQGVPGFTPPDDYNNPSSSVVLNLLKLLYGEDPTHPNPVAPARPPTVTGAGGGVSMNRAIPRR